jgi:para-nitrobenzyl esterase
MKTNRREFVQSLGAGAAGMTLAAPLVLSSCARPPVTQKDGQILQIGDNIAVAETTYGKVRGYILRDIHYFLGIPYGADTSGENRFLPPQKPKPWTDTFPALWWGNSAPQQMEKRYANRYGAFRDQWNYDDVSENCLSINVFTPGYGDGKKRPVLFWMHGGGWANGNSIEHNGYNGENLARYGDIVFCSINHRLGPMGFTDLSAVGGEKYSQSGNVGAMDLVAALQWVRDNIENFGGDPGNVTIMGQSGGGGKVCTTSTLPAAKGLVHKAVVLSGARLQLRQRELKARVGEYILKEAGLKAAQIDKLQQMPWQDYYELALTAAGKCLKDARDNKLRAPDCFQPAADGAFIPRDPYSPDASPNAADLPMMICSTTEEQSSSWQNPSLESISLEDVKKRIVENSEFTGLTVGKAGEIVDAYAKVFPDRTPARLLPMISTHRQRSVMLADVKSKQAAPVFLAWFGWQPPLFDGRLRAFHTVDICFWFHNTDLMLSHTGGGARPRALSEKMAGSLIQFMKTGEPNGGGLPTWTRYGSEKGETMFLDDVSELRNDPDRAARKPLPPYEGY